MGKEAVIFDAYRIECDSGREHYQAIMVNTVTGHEFRWNACVCARQAIYSVSRHNTRHLTFLGATRMVAGKVVPYELTDVCNVFGWTKQHHDFTHVTKLPAVPS